MLVLLVQLDAARCLDSFVLVFDDVLFLQVCYVRLASLALDSLRRLLAAKEVFDLDGRVVTWALVDLVVGVGVLLILLL